MTNPTKELALRFARYISSHGLLGDYAPAVPAKGEKIVHGFSEVRIDEDGAASAFNFKSVEDIFEEFEEKLI